MGYSVGLVLSASPFPVWMIFYVMGVLAAQGIRFPFQSRFPLVWALVGIVLSILQLAWIYGYNGVVAPGIKLTSHFYTYFVLMWLFSAAAKNLYVKVQHYRVVRSMVRLGELSFFVYLTHCLIIFAMNVFRLPDWWIPRWLLTLLLSYVFAVSMDRFLPKGVKRVFGF